MRGLAAHLRVVFATWMASGCVLFVHPDEGGEHCAFRGTTACAACLKTKCQASIDACCRDASCANTSGMLDTMDKCGEGSATSCANGLRTQSTGAAAAAVRDCASTQCGSECTTGATAPTEPVEWKCDANRDHVTSCASCIYDSCTKQIDACCNDSYCSKYNSEIHKDMGACTTGDTAGCAYMATKGDSGLDGALRACIETNCAKPCIDDARPHQSCALSGGGTRCYCNDAEKSSGPDCSIAAVGGSCVLGQKGCSCGTYTCSSGSSSSGACSCSFSGDGSRTTCREPTSGGRCCIKVDSQGVSCACELYTFPCDNQQFEFATDSCDKAVVMSQLSKLLVDKCSN